MPRPPSNISTAIPSNVTVLGVTTQPGNIVTVNMNSAFGEITGPNTELAVGQIVWTVANEVGLRTGVVFEIDGQRTSVPIANGSLVAGPVYLLEFFSVAPLNPVGRRPPGGIGAQPAFSTSRRQGTRGAPDQRCSRS